MPKIESPPTIPIILIYLEEGRRRFVEPLRYDLFGKVTLLKPANGTTLKFIEWPSS